MLRISNERAVLINYVTLKTAAGGELYAHAHDQLRIRIVEECIKAVCSSLTAAHERTNCTTTPQVKAIAAEIAPLSSACDWTSGDGKYVLFHLPHNRSAI
jgi:hypothetical protein